MTSSGEKEVETAMAEFKSSEVQLLLKGSSDRKVSGLADDIALVKSLTKVLNATLDIAKDQPRNGSELAYVLAKKAAAISGVAEKATGSKEIKAANFMATQTLKTVGLFKLAGMSPGKASIYVSLTMAEKVVSAAGMGGFDKCRMAVASLAATTGVGAVSCFATGAFTLGIGCAVGAIAIAADAFDVYGQCYGSKSDPSAFPDQAVSGRLP